MPLSKNTMITLVVATGSSTVGNEISSAIDFCLSKTPATLTTAQLDASGATELGSQAFNPDNGFFYTLTSLPVKANLQKQNVVYTANNFGPAGNDIQVLWLVNSNNNGGAGDKVPPTISVTGNVISIFMYDDAYTGDYPTTAQQIVDLCNSSEACKALVETSLDDPSNANVEQFIDSEFGNATQLGGSNSGWTIQNAGAFLPLSGTANSGPLQGDIDMGGFSFLNVKGINASAPPYDHDWRNDAGRIISQSFNATNGSGSGTTHPSGYFFGPGGSFAQMNNDVLSDANTSTTNLLTMTSIDFSGGNQTIAYCEFTVIGKIFNNAATAAFGCVFKIGATIGFGPNNLGNGSIFNQTLLYSWTADPSLTCTLSSSGTISGGDWKISIDMGHTSSALRWQFFCTTVINNIDP